MTPPKLAGETVKTIAEIGNWDLSDERAEEIARIFQPLYDDTRELRKLELRDAAPDTLFEAD